MGRKGKGLGAPHSLPPCLLSPSKQQQDRKPQIKQTFFKEFHCQNIFSSKLCLKKCVRRKGKGLGAPHSLTPCLLSPSKEQQDRVRNRVKTPDKTNFFLKNFITKTFFPPSYTSKSVRGEREKASVLHISYHHVCFQQQQQQE